MLLDERIEEQEKAGGGLGPRVVLQVGAGVLNARARVAAESGRQAVLQMWERGALHARV